MSRSALFSVLALSLPLLANTIPKNVPLTQIPEGAYIKITREIDLLIEKDQEPYAIDGSGKEYYAHNLVFRPIDKDGPKCVISFFPEIDELNGRKIPVDTRLAIRDTPIQLYKNVTVFYVELPWSTASRTKFRRTHCFYGSKSVLTVGEVEEAFQGKAIIKVD
jgi:hypothetical protein